DGAALPDVRGTVTVVGTDRLIGFENGMLAYERSLDVRLPGAHNRANLAAATAAALELGVDVDALSGAMASLALPPGRYESFAMPGGWRLIYDAYNASPSGTVAALDALSVEDARRTVAVLAGMAELGDESERLHERVGAHAAHRAGVIVAGGDHAAALARGARDAGMPSGAIVEVGSNAETVEWLRANVRPGDAVLLKGSRKYRLEEILEELRS
ncbi:MAG TPA: cyanophycin synthetase, partial [Candidatus Tumulicola sp.]|nr:cyanophycin synthetase [Candidatus Tumulicola sp.]